MTTPTEIRKAVWLTQAKEAVAWARVVNVATVARRQKVAVALDQAAACRKAAFAKTPDAVLKALDGLL